MPHLRDRPRAARRRAARRCVLATGVVAALAVALHFAGCADPAPPPQQLDLWFERPHAVKHRKLTDRERRTFYRGFGGRHVQAVRQRDDERLHWDLHLGSDRRFSFRPLVEAGTCTFVVAAGPGRGKATERHRLVREEAGVRLPARVEVELPDDGDPLHLALVVSGEGCRAAWGSPVVLHRGGSPRSAGARRVAEGRPNVILLGLDTLRADAVGAYGAEPAVTPALDAFARRSDLFLDAYSTANNTNPSFVSLMTGLFNKNHGIYDLVTPLPPSYTTLAEILAEAGYETLAIPAAHHLGARAGIAQGFDRFFVPRGQLYAETVVDFAIDRIEHAEEPFFLFAHFFDAHVPHTPPPPFAEGLAPARDAGWDGPEDWVPFRRPGLRLFAGLRPRFLAGHVDLYPSEVAYLDRQLGRLFAWLDAHGYLESSVVAVVADHGETLGERGHYFDHDSLRAETTHVPLVVHWPGQERGRRVAGLVQHLDLFPTLLRAAGVAPPANDGRDLAAVAAGDAAPRPAVFAEAASHRGEMVRTRRWLYHVEREPGRHGGVHRHLYDLEADAAESTDLAGSGHPEEERLHALLGRWRGDRGRGEKGVSQELTPEEEDELRALGYL